MNEKRKGWGSSGADGSTICRDPQSPSLWRMHSFFPHGQSFESPAAA
ncbi:MAG TPA: hypothetical protein VMT80_00185 [Candidatus Paceibacterota bacterium]|nr:hypothetical protein [Candidatus Paceibacterota bacterium]